jgi:hypothetical protein
VTRPVARAHVEQELARARGARRLAPWAALSAIAAGLIGLAAGGGLRAAGTLVAAGLVFAVFVWLTSVARCPACGARLPRRGGAPDACPRCRTPFGR